MSTPVLVKELALVDQAKSQWLNNILAPAVEKCRFERVPGVKLIPLVGKNGALAGHVPRLNYDWTVELSISSGFWRKSSILHVYIHECAHLCVFHEERRRGEYEYVHGPVFFLVNLVLAIRAGQSLDSLSFYDFQNCPFDGWEEWDWRSVVVAFALRHGQRLADSELKAEAVASQAWDLWEKERVELLGRDRKQALEIKEKERLSGECKSLQGRVAELERQRDVSFTWRFLFVTGWPGVVAAGTFYGGILACLIFAVGYSLGAQHVFS